MRLRYFVVLAAAASLTLASLATAQEYHAHLTGAQEVPPVATTGFGTGVFTLSGTTLSYNVTYKDLVSNRTANHVHGCASVGVNAGVIQGINCNGVRQGTCSGSMTLTAAQIVCLNDSRTYVNIHTSLNGGGEIRGQLLPVPTGTLRRTWGTIKQIYR